MKLSPRLKMVADMVRPGVVAADIGTDHAYIPVYLLENGICSRVIAADLRQGPLMNARASVSAAGFTVEIDVRQSDGLDKIDAHEAQDIIIAGMGGKLIVELLARTAWLRDKDKRLLIQPMSHAQDVREYLCKNGFKVFFEQACFDDQRVYIAMCAGFQGAPEPRLRPAYYYLGELPVSGNDAADMYIKKMTKHLTRRINALTARGIKPEETANLKTIVEDILEACL